MNILIGVVCEDTGNQAELLDLLWSLRGLEDSIGHTYEKIHDMLQNLNGLRKSPVKSIGRSLLLTGSFWRSEKERNGVTGERWLEHLGKTQEDPVKQIRQNPYKAPEEPQESRVAETVAFQEKECGIYKETSDKPSLKKRLKKANASIKGKTEMVAENGQTKARVSKAENIRK